MDIDKLVQIVEKIKNNNNVDIDDIKIDYSQAIEDDPDTLEIDLDDINHNNLLELKEQIEKYLDDINKKEYNINSSFSNITYEEESYRINNIIRDFLDNKFIMPDFQRKYVWSKEQASSLILSSIFRIPIPTIYCYSDYDDESEDDKIFIVDGQQRITSFLFYYYGVFPKSLSVRKFYDADFFKLCEKRRQLLKSESDDKNKLVGLEDILKRKYNVLLNVEFKTSTNKNGIRTEVNLSSDSIDKRTYNIIFGSKLKFTTISNFENTEDLVELFNIYNSGGRPLKPQEIRKCVYYNNKIYKFIDNYTKEMPNNSNFSKFKSSDILSTQRKIFKMLSYYFNITNKYDDKKYVSDLSNINEVLCSNYTRTSNQSNTPLIVTTIDSSILNNGNFSDSIISEYSKFISAKSNEIKLDEEITSLKDFFNIPFDHVNSSSKMSFKNYICIYILLRVYNKLDMTNILPSRALFHTPTKKYGGLLEKERLEAIYDILCEENILSGNLLDD